MTRHFTLTLACLVAAVSVLAQNDWKLQKDESGIRVYSRNTGTSGFDEIRVETILQGRPSSLAAILLDIDNYPTWSFHNIKAYVLKRIGPADLYFYSLIRSPWPASNRDLAVHLRLRQDSAKHVLYIDADEEARYIPETKGVVRVPKSTERWVVTPLTGERLAVSYTLQLDPGESAPAWLINMFSTSGPFETFTNLREQLKRPKYRDASLNFIRN